MELIRLRAFNDVRLISLSSDESRIVCVSQNGTTHILDAATESPCHLSSVSPSWCWAEFLPGGKEVFCVSVGGATRLVECQTGRVTKHPALLPNRTTSSAVFSPQKTHFVSISKTVLINFTDIVTSCGPLSTACSRSFPWLAFSSNGRWLMLVTEDNVCSHVFMWDSKSGQLLWEDLSRGFSAPIVAFSHSGNMAVIWSSSVCCILLRTGISTSSYCT